MAFILAQVFGAIALILVSVGYFCNKKPMFLIFQIVANFFYAISFICLNSFVGGVITLISIFRTLYIFICEKYNFKYTLFFLPIFFMLYITAGIIFWENWFDIISICTAITFTIAFYVKNLQATKYIMVAPNVALIFYNLLRKTYTNAILDSLEVCVLVGAIIKFHLKNIKTTDKAYKTIKKICIKPFK